MRVLVAYDGGEPGEKAMTAIAAWVHEHAADVHVVHVLNPKSIHETPRTTSLQPVMAAGTPNGTVLDAEGPFPVLAESRSQAIDAARTTATEEIAALATRRLGIYPVTPHVVVGTEAAHEIVKLAVAIGADIVVTGAHGRTGLSHVLLGSVAEAVVRESRVPVLVVGPNVA